MGWTRREWEGLGGGGRTRKGWDGPGGGGED